MAGRILIMADELGNHIPWYPEQRSPTYNSEILSKYEYRTHSTANPRQNPIFLNHQRLNQIHLGSQTPNKYLFIYKDPGVGKTCDAIGIAETRSEWIGQVLSSADPAFQRTSMNKAIVVAQNKASMADNFKKDIMQTCTAGVYKTKTIRQANYATTSGEQGAKTKSIQQNYELHTHLEFSNALEPMSQAEIAKKYSFRVIIIDEIHMYKTKTSVVENDDGTFVKEETRGSKIIYTNTMKLIDNVYGCVIVVLSATPVVNDINEFPSVINFILPPEDRVDPNIFRQKTNGDDLNAIRASLEEYLTPKLMGRVSRMKISNNKKKAIVRTNVAPGTKLLKFSDDALYVTEIKSDPSNQYILDYYKMAMDKDNSANKDNQFYMNSIYASNMIWPGGLIGKEAFDLYMRQIAGGNKFEFTEAFIADFKAQHANVRANTVNRIRDRLERERANLDQERVEEIEEELAQREERIRLNPDGSYDPTNEFDFRTMLFTIKSRYSPVYASVLEIIMGIEVWDQELNKYVYRASPETNNIDKLHNRECVYFYNFYKQGGVIPLGLFLTMFGYEQLVIETKSKKKGVKEMNFIDSSGKITGIPKGKRYALLYSDETMKESKMRKLLELANHPDNKYGEYLKVIGGTDVTAQGINFRNVRQSHFTSRKWNQAGNFQAEGRVDRTNSHKEFADEGDPSLMYEDEVYEPYPYGQAAVNGRVTQKYVKIFRHVAYFKDLNRVNLDGTVENLSIALKMYDDSAFKEFKNKIPTDIMERIAYDRLLNLEPGDVVPTNLIGYSSEVLPIDYVTFNLFHSTKEIDEIKCRVRGHFKLYFNLTLTQLVSLCQGYHHSTIIKALTQMINDNERLLDRHGMINYLRESSDIFFLQKTPRTVYSVSEPWMSYYSQHNIINDGINIDSMSNKLDLEEIQVTLETLAENGVIDVENLRRQISRLSFKSKSFLVETMVQQYQDIARARRISKETLQAVFNLLDESVYYFEANKLIIHVFELKVRQSKEASGRQYAKTIPSNSSRELRVFSLAEGIWRYSTIVEDATYIPLINDYLDTKFKSLNSKFADFGRSVRDDSTGIHKFYIINRQAVSESSEILTKSGTVNKKGYSISGRANFSKPALVWYLYRIEIDMYVEVSVYSENENRRGLKPIKLTRLKKDPNGEFESPTTQGVRLSYYLDESGNQASLQLVPIDPAVDVLLGKTILHYTHIYPEVLLWAFDEEISMLDPNIIRSESFLPTGTSQLIVDQNIPRFTNILHLLPPSMIRSIVGDANNRTSSIMYKSLNKLYDLLVGTYVHPTYGYTINPEKTDMADSSSYIVQSTNHLPAHDQPVGWRFNDVYNTEMLTKPSLSILIYVIYFARGSIESTI